MKTFILALCGSLFCSSAFAVDWQYGTRGMEFGNVDGGVAVVCGPSEPEVWWTTSLLSQPAEDKYRVLWVKTPENEYEPTAAFVGVRDGEMFALVSEQEVIATFGSEGTYRMSVTIDGVTITQAFHADKSVDVKAFIDNCNKQD